MKCRKCKVDKVKSEFIRDNATYTTCNQCAKDMIETLAAIRMYSEGNK